MKASNKSNQFQKAAKRIGATGPPPEYESSGEGHRGKPFKNSRRSGSDRNSGGDLLPVESSQEDLSPGDNSSLEGSDNEVPRGDGRKGLIYQKTENFITRIRDLIAQHDVFTTRGESPPFIACLKASIWMIPPLLILCLWDTLCVTLLQIPHLSFINHPGFLVGYHFLTVMFGMYGFMLSYLSSGESAITSQAGISLIINYALMFYRMFLEVYFNGFRGQSKLFIEKTQKAW